MNKEILDNFNKTIDLLDRQVRDLRHHLGIDVKLSIDYSFIAEDSVRIQLEKDNREMIKLKSTDFDNFCRFAHYQIEELLNYFFFKKLGDNVANIISYFSIPASNSDQVKSLDDIPFKTKFIIFSKNYIKNLKVSKPLQGIIYTRNCISHRTTILENDELLKYNKYIQDVKNISDWSSLDDKQKKLKNEGEEIKFRKNLSFSNAENALKSFAQIVKDNM